MNIYNKIISLISYQLSINNNKNLFCENNILSINYLEQFLISYKQEILSFFENEQKSNLLKYLKKEIPLIFYNINQYIDFTNDDLNLLEVIYSKLLKDIYYLLKNDRCCSMHIENILKQHYQNLAYWIKQTNPFTYELYKNQSHFLNKEICSEYNVETQIKVLHLPLNSLTEPVLDIGCGKSGNLVKMLRKYGYEAYGFNRIMLYKTNYIFEDNWMDFDFTPHKWGTIISHLSFANHFKYNHLSGNRSTDYAKKYMQILSSLKTMGVFYYAPSLPFIENLLPKEYFIISRNTIGNYNHGCNNKYYSMLSSCITKLGQKSRFRTAII